MPNAETGGWGSVMFCSTTTFVSIWSWFDWFASLLTLSVLWKLSFLGRLSALSGFQLSAFALFASSSVARLSRPISDLICFYSWSAVILSSFFKIPLIKRRDIRNPVQWVFSPLISLLVISGRNAWYISLCSYTFLHTNISYKMFVWICATKSSAKDRSKTCGSHLPNWFCSSLFSWISLKKLTIFIYCADSYMKLVSFSA